MEALGSSETSVLKELRGFTFQKTAFCIVGAVKTTNLTYLHREGFLPTLETHSVVLSKSLGRLVS
jgi:hypothetical protein